jgi:predicted AlkP superfamily phosphohydrolase/phosphomutase
MSFQHPDTPNSKVLIVGLDGATYTIIEPLIKQGKLPTLASLINQGTSGILKSTIPPVTIPAWISMLTSKNPGKLGVFDLLHRVGYRSEPNELCYEGQSPLWLILNKYNLRTGLLNIPGTFPPTKLDGYMVTGMLTPSKKSQYTYPEELATYLDNAVDEYNLDVPQWQYFDKEQFINDLQKTTLKRRIAVEYLNRYYPCDFNMIVFTGSDRIQHVLYDTPKDINKYWEYLDREIGMMLKYFPKDTNIFIVSDHGFGPLKKTFFVNKWLRRMKYLRVKTIQKDRLLGRIGHLIEFLYRGLGWFFSKIPGTTWILNKLKNSIGIDNLRKLTYEYLSKDKLADRVAWRRTRAFSCVHSPHFGQIYLNKKDKMPRGTVKETEISELIELITSDLMSLKDPETGQNLKIEIFKPEEIYNGEYLEDAPDIIFIIEDGTIEIDATIEPGRYLVEGNPLTGWSGTQTRDGIIIAKGPHIKKGHKIKDANILDLTPTILHIFGIPLQEEIDGKVLLEIFDEQADFLKRSEISEKILEKPISKELSEEEKALINDRLRKLGYIS